MDSQKGYHLIPANFNQYDFHKLFEEEKDNDRRILWKIGREDGKNAQKYNIGDIVYIYYTNLPDGTMRLLMRAKVAESDTDAQLAGKAPRFSYDPEKKIKGIWLEKVQSVALYDRTRFDIGHLAEQYGIHSPIKGQCYLWPSNPQHKKLIDEIENKQLTPRFSLKSTKEYFDDYTRCFFTKKSRRNHGFISGRGVNFSEKHHFVLNASVKKDQELFSVLEKDDNNLIYVCPTCHRQLHHGLAEDVEELLQQIYEENQAWCDKKLLPLAKARGFDGVMPWVYEVYNAERKKNHYQPLGER